MLPTRIFPLGENAVTVEFGSELSEPLNDAAAGLAAHFESHPFPGFIEAVPAIASVTIFYRTPEVRRDLDVSATAFEHVKSLVNRAAVSSSAAKRQRSRLVEVPVDFSVPNAPDLSFVAEHSGLAVDDVVQIFLSAEYRVYMLGFLPGFAYMGIVDDRIAVPRKASPRLAVPKGSVAIAGRQAGIYPDESPGGWQIIGRTDIPLFTPGSVSPCHFRPGDTVRFIDAAR